MSYHGDPVTPSADVLSLSQLDTFSYTASPVAFAYHVEKWSSEAAKASRTSCPDLTPAYETLVEGGRAIFTGEASWNIDKYKAWKAQAEKLNSLCKLATPPAAPPVAKAEGKAEAVVPPSPEVKKAGLSWPVVAVIGVAAWFLFKRR